MFIQNVFRFFFQHTLHTHLFTVNKKQQLSMLCEMLHNMTCEPYAREIYLVAHVGENKISI